MADIDSTDQLALLAELTRRGMASSAQLQHLLGKSQPTLSRLLARLAQQQLAVGQPPLVVLGRQRSARYALAQPLLGLPGQQPLFWTDEAGRREAWGQLTHLGGERLHLQADGIDLVTAGRLPWLLAPMRLQGFLGRLWARSMLSASYDANPERWRLDQLLALLLSQVHDLPGAIALGDLEAPAPPQAPADPAALPAFLDAQALAVASTLPAGSSAGGEQAKFLCAGTTDSGLAHWLVKFSPPLGTPFGDRWSILLQAEALALQVLAAHGVPVADARLLQSDQRTYLISTRFDRIGSTGARHVVPLDAVHDAFVPGPRRDWAATCQALAAQRRLPVDTTARASALLQFGRLIGNTDMHFGNLSLVVSNPADAARGRFSLAPVYDMLPMRWRPDAQSGVLDWLPFTPDARDLASGARPVALQFWQRAHDLPAAPPGFRQLAAAMAQSLAEPG